MRGDRMNQYQWGQQVNLLIVKDGVWDDNARQSPRDLRQNNEISSIPVMWIIDRNNVLWEQKCIWRISYEIDKCSKIQKVLSKWIR